MLESQYLGKVDFEKAYQIQKDLWSKVKSERSTKIIGLEHPAVITLGRRAEISEVKFNNEVKNLFVMDSLQNKNSIPVVKATRGGLATLHSEGQLIIYPILKLAQYQMGVRDYVYLLLNATQKTFLKYHVNTYADDLNIGLYTEHGKIAFCGVEIKNGISLHGLSINITNDLKLFQNIKACGFESLELDRLCHYRTDVTPSDFYHSWITEFKALIQSF